VPPCESWHGEHKLGRIIRELKAKLKRERKHCLERRKVMGFEGSMLKKAKKAPPKKK